MVQNHHKCLLVLFPSALADGCFSFFIHGLQIFFPPSVYYQLHSWVQASKIFSSHFLLSPLPGKIKYKSCNPKHRAEELVAWGKGETAGEAWSMPGRERRGTSVWKEFCLIVLHRKKKRQASKADWRIFLVERPESLQPKWEPHGAGNPTPPTDLCEVHSWNWGGNQHSLKDIRVSGLHINPNSKSVSIKHIQTKAPVLPTWTLSE